MKRALLGIGFLTVVVLIAAGCSLLQVSPSVDFDASVTEGQAPLHVRFTPRVDGAPTSYAWDFGDGRTSDEPNPVHVYTKRGTYSVMLTVEFADAEPVALIKKRLVTVEQTPLVGSAKVYLYWISDYGEYGSRIRRGSRDGIVTEDLLVLADAPSGLDVGGGKIYWVTTTTTGGRLESSKLDGSNRRTLIEVPNQLGDVAVDVNRGKVYWTALPESPRSSFEPNKTWDGGLMRADLDGSNVKTMIEYPSGSETYADRIVVDPDGGLVVWSVVGDGFEGAIQMALVSPFEPIAGDLVTGVGRPRGMTLDTVPGFGANNLYYTTGDELRRVGLFWFGSKATILTGLDDPSGVAVDSINYYVWVGTQDGILRAVTDGTNLEKLPFYDVAKVGPVVLPR